MTQTQSWKLILISFCSMLTIQFANAQGWVGNPGQRLIAVNDSLRYGSLFVGIGTNTPTSQLHTTGSVRFTGLTQFNAAPRYLVQDSSGSVFWKDAATIGSSNAWLLTGNAGTNPASNFVGTTDTARLVFRTNNVEKATILSNGNTGIGLSTPIKLLHIHSSSTAEDNTMMISGRSPSIWFSQNPTQPASGQIPTPFARLCLASRSGAFVTTSAAGDFVLQALTSTGSLLFGTGVDSIGTNGLEKARISPAGNFGINTIAPTAKLHVNGTVRFQGLTTGTGSVLVIDANGNVYKSATQSARVADTDDALQQQVNELKQALADVQAQLAALKSGSLEVTGGSNATASYSLSSAPNPTSGSTTIRYTYPGTVGHAYLTVTDLNGKQVKRVDLKTNSGNSVNLSLDGATAGTYVYSLELDGRVVESRKLMLAR
jgi:hypothetical protein